MGIELVILTAQIFGNRAVADLLNNQRPAERVMEQQQIYIEQQDTNTKRILEAIENVKK